MTDLLLNYHDACIYRSDLRLVESPTEWLNDACINFQMTRLQQRQQQQKRKRSREDATTDDTNNDNNLLFLDPAVVSYMMHQCDDDDLGDLGRSWFADLCRASKHAKTRRKAGLIVPVNDANAGGSQAFQTIGGGNHWSVLLVDLVESSEESNSFTVEKILHFDSHGTCNSRAAVAVAARVCNAMSLGSGGDIHGSSSNRDKISLTHCTTPQQGNGYDCGIFALGTADALSDPSLWANDNVVVEDMEAALQAFVANNGGASFAKTMRQRIANDIRTLAAGGQ